MNSTLEYLDCYRQKRQELKDAIKLEQDLQFQIETQRSVISGLKKEVTGMRKLITYMIDNDMDPVEAQLRTESEDRKESFWENPIDSSYVYTMGAHGGGGATAATTTWLTVPAATLATGVSIIGGGGAGGGSAGATGAISSTDAYYNRKNKIPGV